VRISDEQPLPDAATGTSVIISDLKKDFGNLKSESTIQELSEIFAIYLKDYRNVQIRVDGSSLDPNLAIVEVWNQEMSSIVDDEGQSHGAALEVIEWRNQTRRTLYLCSESGFPLSQVDTRFHIGNFHF